MAHEFDSTRPIGGLNSEDEVRIIPEGDYLHASNIRNSITAANKGKTLTNVLGNLQITQYNCPYNGGTFPTGTNRCIGAVEDIVNNGAIYMVWNSQGKHGIYRYYRDLTDPNNPYGVVEQVMQYDFGWDRTTRITSLNIVYGDPTTSGMGDLLYWCDPVPKKINLTKGNICEKQKSWQVVLPVGFEGQAFFFQVVVKNFLTGANVASLNVNIAPNLTIAEMFVSLAAQINTGLGNYLTAEACDCSMTITEDAVNGYNILFTDPNFYVIPGNWYGTSLIDRFWDRCKWQPMQAPQVEYGKDSSFEPNYVVGKVFQFRLEYVYDDNESSALGVWSKIAINNLGCDGTNNTEYNYIDVNFNDPLLLQTDTLVLLKKVRVIARELNTGNDRAIIELEPCEFLDYANSAAYSHYKFYNNVDTLPIDAVLAAKLFDDVPLESGAEILTNNRIVEANCLTGYDAPECAGATYEIDFADEASIPTYTVTFYIRIFNAYLDNSTNIQPRTVLPNILERRSGIFFDTDADADYPYFGGAAYNGGVVVLYPEAATTFKQQIPEGGFPVYAAGTPYYAISRQIAVPKLTQRSDGSIDITGALDTRDFVEDWFEDGTVEVVAGNPIGEYDLYSVVQIKVPRGKYVFRPASHYCSFDDKLGKGTMYDLNNGTAWHQTSTYVWGTINELGNYTFEKEITIDVTGDVFGGEFIIADACYYTTAGDFTNVFAYTGYLIDNFGQTDIPALRQGVTVEKAKITVTGLTTPNLAVTDFCITDHNGFFFIIKGQPVSLSAVRLIATQIKNGGAYNIKLALAAQYKSTLKSALADLQTGDLTPQVNLNVGYLEYIVPVGVQTARQDSSTFIEGTVTNLATGLGAENVSLVYQNGRAVVTNSQGEFSILAWNDMAQNNLVPSNERIVDSVIVNYPCDASVTYPNGTTFAIAISPFNPNYSPTLIYPLTGVEINASGAFIVKAHKRGGQYQYVLRYYDEAGRLCSCVPVLSIYVPFITEDLNKALPNQYPANTFKYGVPTISWTLQAGYNPPEWAAYYQWMRTKNTFYGRYLQWVVNNVTYLSKLSQDSFPEIETSYANGDAIAVKLSLSNIVDFSRTNPLSQVGYVYEDGDRLRLIANRDGSYFDNIQDLEIVSADSTTSTIIVKLQQFTDELFSGAYIEIFNPKSVTDDEQQVFYEVGEVYECTAPNTAGNQHSVTSGTFTNGDTYWRLRTIVVNDDTTNYASVYPLTIEDASISDFYSSQAQDIGRIGIIDPNFKQIRRPMLLKASNQYIPSTATNGLSSFEALNEKELDRANGAIQRLVQINQYVVAISNVRETSNYIQVVTFQQATQGQGVLAVADQFFGTAYPHSKTLGTDLPASVFINDGQIFGYHSKRSDVWLYRGDGEMAISDVKMKNYFQQLGIDGVSDAVGIYDRFHEEYILTVWRKYNEQTTVSVVSQIGSGYFVTFTITNETLPLVNELVTYQYLINGVWTEATGLVLSVEGTSVTIVTAPTFPIRLGGQLSVTYSVPETVSWFNGNEATDKNRWITFYSFTPEAYCQLGSDILSFKDGKVWIHGKNQTRNNFYGQQYITEITPVFNDKPEYLKVWNSCILMQFQDNNGNDWSAPVIQNNNGQLSRLKKGAWVKKGEHWYCAFKRDLNDLAVAQNLRISQGRALRSTSLTVELNNDYTGEVTLYGWLANWTNSERTSK